MDYSLTLPPLVRGKPSGCLTITLNEVNITKNVLPLKAEYNIAVCIQWWGEPSPVFISPAKLYISHREESIPNEYVCSNSVTYQIRTLSSLLKAYLETCDVLELVVLEQPDNSVIGSAFLRNLTDLIQYKNESFQLPFVDYLGDKIGEIKLYINFTPNSKKEVAKQLSHNVYSNGNNENSITVKDAKSNEKIIKNHLVVTESETHDNMTCGINKNVQVVNCSTSSKNNKVGKLSAAKHECTSVYVHANKNTESGCNSTETCQKSKQNSSDKKEKEQLVPVSNNLPVVQTFKDFSKVLSFDVRHDKKLYRDSNKSREKTKQSGPLRNLNKNMRNRTVSAVRNCSRPISTKVSIKSDDSKSVQSNLVVGTRDKLSVPEECPCKSRHKSQEDSIEVMGSHDSGRGNTCVRDSQKQNILDYLLGREMTKEDEMDALNDLKLLSPSQSFVRSVSQSLLSPVISDVHKRQQTSNSSCSICQKSEKNRFNERKDSQINFNFNHPIEKRYYDTFFARPEVRQDFEIAEILNMPQVSCHLDEPGVRQHRPEHGVCHSARLPCSKQSTVDDSRSVRSCLTGNNSISRNTLNSALKYYSKLAELDKIIDSLKDYEKTGSNHL